MTFTQYYKPDDMSTSVPEHLQTDEELQQQIMDINLLYSAAIREVSTKLDVLGDDFRMKHSYVPIHHMQSRLKSFESLMDKAERYGIEDPIHNLDTVRAEVFDIAGIRVVCNYREDIYTMSELLLKQSDVDLIKIKDYCKNPKPSGYRSLHVVISIPVFLVNSKTTVPVEIQFRSIAMDTWASLEHELKYKNKGALTEDIQKQLTQCAKTLSDVDEQMERIRHQVF
ncbi:MAG: GTP pyrophosphokinase family protein [Mogibacterium sp.]|uniref:GTP pyrophosphokinase n=1 Tax=Mogibacterium sp. TaxID=2049035 RepID=UPI001A3C76BD|nr:GTP pyrophosphokinase family protein [Mogibacterium sp.]MBL6468249.1 GTP pyrophosphokinase family protein [Mogibacterium sp.]